jgi:peptide/nickel transport system permease protein
VVVEELTAEALRADEVTEPYTRMLLDAVPKLDRTPAAGR